jgi:lipoprotein-releasing system permease protein
MIALAAFVLSALATVFPSRRAARVEPAEALRYD